MQSGLNNLILIAPDVEREAFLNALSGLSERFRDISVFATDRDHLLLLSAVINNGERLGRSVDLELDEVEVIDVSELDMDYGEVELCAGAGRFQTAGFLQLDHRLF